VRIKVGLAAAGISQAHRAAGSRPDAWRFLAEPYHLTDWWPGASGVQPDRRGVAVAQRDGLAIGNRQRARRINLTYLRKITRALLDVLLPSGEYDLAIHLIAKDEMIRLNETYVHHKGPTDVITFDYGHSQSLEPGSPTPHSEIFVCVEVAIAQARRFGTSWQSEVVRYIIHGALHLQGFDDRRAAARRVMKQEESRVLRLISRKFNIARLLARK
jgi:probable rRNA maturation factor